MKQAQSISLSQFTSTVQAAVKSALEKHPKFQADTPKGITFSYLIRGIQVSDRFTLAETQAFADDIANHVRAAHPEILAGAGTRGVVYAAGGHVTVGIPAVESFLLEK